VIMTFVVPGKPAGKARPRLNRLRGHIYSPDPGAFQVRVAEFGFAAGLRPADGPFELVVTIARKLPKSWSKVKRERMRGEWAEGKPDTINVGAAICDGLEGVAWHDDLQVATIRMYRHWADEDSTHITVKALREEHDAVTA
jgi:Holliday junction resolvase RusA-like endonuclease